MVREDVARRLEEDGWEIVLRDPIEARRNRGEQSEALYIGKNGRLRYTRTRLVGDEQFSRVREDDRLYRVVSRTEEETTVTTDAPENRLAETIAAALRAAGEVRTQDEVRGVEGQAGHVYFDNFRRMVRADREVFSFNGRNRRPPRDRVNALLSLIYSVVRGD